MIEQITRLLAAWRERRWDRLRRRRAGQRAAEVQRRVDFLAYEDAHKHERLRLAQELLVLAVAFAQSDEGRWACATFGRWPVAGALEVDSEGRLWRHIVLKFTNPRRTPMDTAEALAANFATAALRAARPRLIPESFWARALEEEVLYHLGLRGRPV
jgi:hypothetical protein